MMRIYHIMNSCLDQHPSPHWTLVLWVTYVVTGCATARNSYQILYGDSTHRVTPLCCKRNPTNSTVYKCEIMHMHHVQDYSDRTLCSISSLCFPCRSPFFPVTSPLRIYPWHTSDPLESVQISSSETPAVTVPAMFARMTKENTGRTALAIPKVHTDGYPKLKIAASWTYKEYYDECSIAARGFISVKEYVLLGCHAASPLPAVWS